MRKAEKELHLWYQGIILLCTVAEKEPSWGAKKHKNRKQKKTNDCTSNKDKP